MINKNKIKEILQKPKINLFDFKKRKPVDFKNIKKEEVKKGKYDIEKESKKEIGEALQKIREREKDFRKELDLSTDTDFYFQVVFESPEKMKEFVNKYKIKLQYNDFIFFEDIEHLLKS